MLQDADVRAEVLDPSRSFIVQAPAGSGKTGILTQRFLRLLAGVEQPETVVAITFTRKAAAEMRDRLLEALVQGGDPSPPEDDYQRRTWELARQVLAQDHQHQWHLVQHPARLRVLTIDSLCAAIARQMPVSSGLGVPPGYTQEPDALFRQAARDVLAQLEEGNRWSPAVARLLDHLDNNPGRVETLLADLLARRDQWLRFLAGGRLSRQNLEFALAALVREQLQHMATAWPPPVRDSLPELLHFAANNLPPEQHDSPLVAWQATGIALPEPRPEDLSLWRGIATLLLTREGTWRAKVDRRNGFPPESTGRSPQEKKRFRTMKSQFMATRETLAAIPNLDNRLHAVHLLPDPVYSAEQWEILQALEQLLPMAAAALRVLFAERGVVDFTEVAMAAVRALGRDDNPTDLALRLDHQIRHLLVDEFQDTSRGQFQLLEHLTAGWQPDDGRTLFLVGDPMQSIYRFREAEVGLFYQVQQRGLGSVSLQSRNLSVNFRSDGGLVAWVNTLFKELMPNRSNPLTGETPFVAAHPFHPARNPTPVASHPQIPAAPETEAGQVVATVQDALHHSPEEKIAILVRSRNHLGDIVPALRRSGIPFQAVEIAALAGTPVVQDLFALTRALLHPADRVHWLALLRAPWCGLTLTELLILTGEATTTPNNTTLWECLHDPIRTSQLNPASRSRLERVGTVLTRAWQLRRRMGWHHGAGVLRRWVETTWYALGGPATLKGPEEMEDALVFLDLLESLEQGGDLTDFRHLDRGLEKLFAAPVHADALVQVMTIHKAKGLEFGTVILPGLGRKSRGASSRLLLWMERPAVPDAEALLLAPLKRSDQADPDPIYAFLASIDREKERLETARLLYVAVTRARRSLHLFGQAEVAGAAHGSFLHLLWPAVQADFAEATPATSEPDLPATSSSPAEPPANPDPPGMLPELRRFPAGWQPPSPPPGLFSPVPEISRSAEDSLVFIWAGETVRCVGIVVHHWLQVMAREGTQAWNVPRIAALEHHFAAQLTRLGVASPALSPAIRQVAMALTSTLADPRGQWILDPRHGNPQSELALTGHLHGRIRRVVLDRTFIDADNTRWIIDFKTGHHAGGDLEGFLDNEQIRYQEHMETYASLMHALDDRPIRLGLYFPLAKGGWREWLFCKKFCNTIRTSKFS
ncbi:MAG: UvrD-helicase domain-containing protein [Magnetococcales bacterium]|nr:UvrD-helicase domain-containing protein [Magnetococcales bacterium]